MNPAETVTCNVFIQRENSNNFYLLCSEGPEYGQKLMNGGSFWRPETIKVSKKRMLEGSDNLGIPESDWKPGATSGKSDKVREGKMILPKWYATSLGIFPKNIQEDSNE